LADAGIPSFGFPEDAVRALGRVARYGEWRRRPPGHIVEVTDADTSAARAVVDDALAEADDVWLTAPQTDRLLRAFGIPTARTRSVATPEEAAAAQQEIGGPVAVKLAAPIHKTELDGVRLGLRTAEEAADAVRDMAATLRANGQGDLLNHGFVVQEMVADGVEMVVGVSHDPMFGPIVMVGLGGTLVELLADVSMRIHPLTDHDIDDMLIGLRGYPLLTGYRGSPPLDVLALKNVLVRVNALVETVPEIHELDLNPVFVRASGVTAVDARIRLSRDARRSL
jgi:acyl-CoA synthetase (NDP forming)